MISATVSQITGVSSIYSTVCSGADQRKYQRSASLAFVRGIHRSPVNYLHKGPKTRKMFPFNDVIVHPLCATGLGWPFTLQKYTCVKWTLYYSHWSNTSVHTCHISLYFVIEKVAFFWPKVCWSKRSFNTYLWYVGNSNDLVLLLTHPADAQIGTFCVIWVKTIVAGALTPCVATSSTAML